MKEDFGSEGVLFGRANIKVNAYLLSVRVETIFDFTCCFGLGDVVRVLD